MKQMIQKSLRILLSVLMLVQASVTLPSLIQAEDDWVINSVSIDPVEKFEDEVDLILDEDGTYYPRYQVQPKNAVVETNHGEFSGTLESICSELQAEGYTGASVSYQDPQDEGTVLTVGSYDIAANFCGGEYHYLLTIKEGPVKNVTIEDVSYYPWETSHVIDADGNEYETYTQGYEPCTVETIYGTFTYDNIGEAAQNLTTQFEIFYQAILLTNDYQSYQNQWQPGTDHTFRYTLNGHETEYQIHVLNSPVVSASVDPLYYSEDEARLANYYFSDTDIRTFYYFDPLIKHGTVELNDGTRFEGDMWELRSQIEKHFGTDFGCNTETDETYGNEWGVGEHDAILKLGIVDIPFKVYITESNLDSFTMDPMVLYEGNTRTEYDDNTGESWERYDIYNCTGTLNCKDGTSYSDLIGNMMHWYYEKYGKDIYISLVDHQSKENPWGVGTHTVEACLGKHKATFTVEVKENPLVSMSAEDFTIYEGQGNLLSATDPNTGEDTKRFHYSSEPKTISVALSDGTVLSGDYYDVLYKLSNNYGLDPVTEIVDLQDDQEWTAGDHRVKLRLGNLETYYTVHVLENPIRSITVKDMTVYDGSQIMWEDWIDGSPVTYRYFELNPQEVTVVTKDGEVKGTMYTVMDQLGRQYNGHFYWVVDTDQGYGHEWEAGKNYQATFTLGTISSEPFTVSVKESPILSVTVEDKNVPEDAYLYSYQNGSYYYDINPAQLSVETTEGTFSGSNGQVNVLLHEHFGDSILLYASGDTQHEQAWKKGETHTLTLKCGSIETEYHLTITDPVIADVKIDDVTVFYGDTSTVIADTNTGNYSILARNITIKTRDGKTFEGQPYTVQEEFYEQYGFRPANLSTYHSLPGDSPIGDYPVTQQVGFINASFTIHIVASPILSFEVESYSIMEGNQHRGNRYVNGNLEEVLLYMASPYKIRVKTADKEYYGFAEEVVEKVNKDLGSHGIIATEIPYVTADWKKGETHTLRARFLGVPTEYQVTIVENKVDSMSARARHMKLSEAEEIDDGLGNLTKFFVCVPDDMSVVINNREYRGALEDVRREIFEKEHIYLTVFWRSSQELGEEWGVGEHTAYIGYSQDDINIPYQVIIEADDPANPFIDVSEDLGGTTYKAILWAYENGIVKGTSANTYSPSDHCTRAQLCVMLWRLKGKPAVNVSDNPFPDVTKELGNTTYKAILWAYQQGIVKGNADGTFNPSGDTTRANMAVMLWRTAGKPTVSATTNPFEDVSKSLGNTTYKSILWAYDVKLTKGTDKTHFSPNDPCTRAQLAVFLYRLNNLFQYLP